MNPELLEEILSCPSLPTLPAVALRIIELTSDSKVSLEDLADTVQNDQGLATKVLRTINSSFYGLRTRCTTIQRAFVMLGLAPVKSLALGFSLVSALSDQDQSFDYVAYWRRGLYTGVAAKCIAEAARLHIGDEAFLGGLLQDVGQMALYRALGDRYTAVLAKANGDHRRLTELELVELEVHHADVGAMLAQRWKLPEELVLPVKYHERPTAAPQPHLAVVRAVGLGNIAHDALTHDESGDCVRRLYAKGQEWFELTPADMDAVLRRIAEAAKEMSSLFKLNTGKACVPDEVVRIANQKLIEITRQTNESEAQPDPLDSLLVNSNQVDPLTGTLTRGEFDATVRRAFGLSRSSSESMTILNVALDGLDTLVRTRGQGRGDEVLVGAAALLKKHFEPLGGAICRVEVAVFAVVFLGAGSRAVMTAADAFHTDLRRAASIWSDGAVSVSATLGVASLDPEARAHVGSPAELVTAASAALREARAAGGDTVRVATARAAA